MPVTNVKLSELDQAYRDWLGEPVKRLQFRHESSDDRVPTELEVLLFRPEQSDQLPDHKQFTYVATAGMSTRRLEGPHERVELVLRVDGKHSDDELELLGNTLAKIAVVPFLEKLQLGPGRVLCDIEWPLFTEMHCALLTHWAVTLDRWLSTKEPLALLLSIVPIHEREAEVVARIGELEANARFVSEGINWHDPHRSIARLTERTPPAVSKASEAPAASAKEIEIDSLWNDIENWYKQHAPDELEKFAGPASEEDIVKLEEILGLMLPHDYKTSLRRHNGGGYLHNYEYFSTDEVAQKWTELSELKAAGKFDDAVMDLSRETFQQTWWHVAWIPIADAFGSLICLDMDPTEKGIVGQVLQHETHAEGPILTRYHSFGEWLNDYKNELYDGQYGLDEYGNFGPV